MDIVIKIWELIKKGCTTFSSFYNRSYFGYSAKILKVVYVNIIEENNLKNLNGV